MPEKQKCIVVLGMHRSGTSALTGVLSLLGIHPGNSLMPAAEGINPKGFWEHAEIVLIHDQLLESLGSAWNDESPLPSGWWTKPHAIASKNTILSVLRRDFNQTPIWLIKDPRMCRLLPLWQEIFRELSTQPLFVLTLRDPSEVSHSLLKRDQISHEITCLLWLNHMLEAEYQTRGQARVFVSYEHLISNWQKTVDSIGQTLNLDWPFGLANVAHEIDVFLDPALHHYTGNTTPHNHPACRSAQEAFELLSAPTLDFAKLDCLHSQVKELTSLLAPWAIQLHQSELQLHQASVNERVNQNTVAELAEKNERLQGEIQRIKRTASWQITKPLRLLAWVIRKTVAVSSPQEPSNVSLRVDDCCALVPFGYPAKTWSTAPQIAVICHMFYVDTLEEFARYLSNIPFTSDLYITTDTLEKQGVIEKGFPNWAGKVEVRITPNIGRDIAPMLIACRDVYDNYEYILHIHSKKSPHHGPLINWRSYLLDTLLGSTKIVDSIFEAFQNSPSLGMIAPQHFGEIRNAIGWGRNFKITREFAQRMGIKISRNASIDFPSGSMFWARSSALKPLLDCRLSLDEFPLETGQLDGTPAHAIERLFFFSCERAGYDWIKIARRNSPKLPAGGKLIKNADELRKFMLQCQNKLIK